MTFSSVGVTPWEFFGISAGLFALIVTLVVIFFGTLIAIAVAVLVVGNSSKEDESTPTKTKSYNNPVSYIPNYRVSNIYSFKMPKLLREFSKDDYLEIKKMIISLFRQMHQIIDSKSLTTSNIQLGIGKVKDQEVARKCKEIDVSRINMKGSRVPVNVLKDYGINTIYELSQKKGSLTYYKGIGEASYNNIIQNLNTIVKDLKENAGVKLSYDDRYESSNSLVRQIAIYLKTKDLIDKAKQIVTNEARINQFFKDLKHHTSLSSRIFNRKVNQEKAQEIIDELNKYLSETPINDLNDSLVIPFNEAIDITKDEAWEMFKQDPIPFNKVLESFKAKPTLENPAGEYGLDADVANNVKNTLVDLTGLKIGLRQYQEWATKYIICQKKTIIGDEMGLGKTVEAIAAMIHLKNNGKTHFMVICPLSVLTNWCREIYKFSSIPYFRIHKDNPVGRFKKWMSHGGVAVTTYETLNNLPLYEEYDIDLLVVDEAHFIKNPYSIRSRNTRDVIQHAEKVTFLTGTVLENKVDEMVELISNLNDSVAQTVKRFYSSPEEFRKSISSVYFRRRRDDVLDELPEKSEIEEWCDLNEAEERNYERLVMSGHYMIARKLSWDAGPYNSTKMARLKEIAEMAKQEDRRVLVFSFFREVIKMIYDEFKHNVYGPIDGSVSSEERQKIIDKFNKSPSGSILVSQIQAGGVGLNIQSASIVVICEPQLKPSIENQAISRAYRMGQARKVLVYRLLATNTIDERLNDLLTTKQAAFDDYADKSYVANRSFEIDSTMFKGLMKKEYERIVSKYSHSNKVIDVDSKLIEKALDSTLKKKKTDIDLSRVSVPKAKGLSVTQRIKDIKQPRGGFIPISNFEVTQFNDGLELKEENVSPGLIGEAVDYLSRFMNGSSKAEAFKISLLGASMIYKMDLAKNLLDNVRGLDNTSIIAAIKLAGFDVVYRAGLMGYKPVELINPDSKTIFNIRVMVNRSIEFFKKYGPVVKDGFTFEGAYTDIISKGDGDFVTSDTMWDFKASKYEPLPKYALQLIIYYYMGKRSIHSELHNIEYIGIFNPRLNKIYRYKMSDFSKEAKDIIEKDVIGYSE